MNNKTETGMKRGLHWNKHERQEVDNEGTTDLASLYTSSVKKKHLVFSS